MGQIALGFRSLLIKFAVFFIMAALLAWALGGTLWPRAEVVDYAPVSLGQCQWFWRLTAGGRTPGAAHWSMMTRCGQDDPVPASDHRWVEAAGPLRAGDRVYFAGRDEAGSGWTLLWATGPEALQSMALPDRLAVEIALARLRSGEALPRPEVIEAQRSGATEPGAG